MTRFVDGLLWLLGLQLAGELLVRLVGIPVPGAVVGMVLLFGLLSLRLPARGWRRRVRGDVLATSDGLLAHLQLLFVPAGVGVFAYLDVLGDHPVPVAAGLLVSWLAGLLVVAYAGRLLADRPLPGRRRPPADPDPTGDPA